MRARGMLTPNMGRACTRWRQFGVQGVRETSTLGPYTFDRRKEEAVGVESR